eukprot:TRINITY_DN3405_c0_g1_i1.p1 TRINITY_DN3405_c0_g1~~TRINITY_DN3405_c0_g1_i1.p1  ORF type:complete len:150 (+),score=8.82 TRINITY_DN3405_c0_g1_i1:2-451(+)
MKIFAACLSKLWLVTPNWVEDSTKAGKWMPSKDYGNQYHENPFQDKNFYFTPTFLKETEKVENGTQLITKIGRGKVKKGLNATINHIVVADRDDPKYAEDARALTWVQLLDLVPYSKHSTSSKRTGSAASEPRKKVKAAESSKTNEKSA